MYGLRLRERTGWWVPACGLTPDPDEPDRYPASQRPPVGADLSVQLAEHFGFEEGMEGEDPRNLMRVSMFVETEPQYGRKALIDQREFSYARRLLARSREQSGEDQSQRLRLAQRLARATMNDTDLPAELRLDRALAVLSERCALRTTKNQETDKAWGMRQGAKDYLTKPVDESDLVKKINAVI